MLTVSDRKKLVHAFMTSRLDYCNALLGGCPASPINKLYIIQNAAARVLTRSRKYDHITPILQSLHWLPIKFRISYKILLLVYKTLDSLAPAYLTSLLSRYNPTRSLRSQISGLLVVPLIRQIYLFKRILLCFSLGWTNNFCLDGTTAMLIMSLFVSLFLPRD